jgi:hypothetical protein
MPPHPVPLPFIVKALSCEVKIKPCHNGNGNYEKNKPPGSYNF